MEHLTQKILHNSRFNFISYRQVTILTLKNNSMIRLKQTFTKLYLLTFFKN